MFPFYTPENMRKPELLGEFREETLTWTGLFFKSRRWLFFKSRRWTNLILILHETSSILI